MSNTYDVIVIGGGHNGLTAATTLANRGRKVLLLEKRPIPGGVAAGEEFHPGYFTAGLLQDASTVRRKVIRDLNLEEFGLNVQNERPGFGILSKGGHVLNLSADTEQACLEISKFSEKDASAYREYRSFISKIAGFISNLMDEFPPDLMTLGTRQIWELARKGLKLKRLGKKTMLEFLKVAPMSVADFLNERFETDFLKAGIAGPAIYGSYTGPWSSYTTLNLLIWECTSAVNIEGGPRSLVESLRKAAIAAGVEIMTDAAVDKIVLDGGRSVSGVRLHDGREFQTSIVASSTTPHTTFFELLLPNQISYGLEHGITYYRSRGTTAKVNLALGQPISLNTSTSLVYARTGNTFDDMEKAFDSVKYRRFSEEPVLDIHIASQEDPSMAPKGHSSVSILVHFAPHHFDEGWNETTKNRLLKAVINTLELYSPDVSSQLVASEVLTPVDFEFRYGLTFGHIFHGEHAVDQLVTRPIPSCARYETPINGLYLCGSGSHPGGGITCMPGYLGAQMILKTS